MNSSEIILYTDPQGQVRVEVYFEAETFWLSQKKMAALFGKDVRTIHEHLKNIFATKELDRDSTIRNFRIVQTEGQREVSRAMDYNPHI